MRHKDHILSTIRYGLNNARIEATNNKIKLLIRQAYGFRDVDNMIDMVLSLFEPENSASKSPSAKRGFITGGIKL